MSAVAAPADRRFRRAHVKPARRRGSWAGHLKAWLGYAFVALVAAYGLYRGSRVAARASVLQIDRIVVRGNERLSPGEILAVLSGLRGESLVWTDLDLWRQRLLTSPWVSDAALRRVLPSTVEVVVWERQPVGIGRLNGEMYVIDDHGAIIDQYGPEYSDLDLPIVDGLGASAAADRSMTATTDGVRAELAARVISAFKAKPDVARRLSQVDVSDLHNAKVILTGDPAVIALGDDQFLARLQSYLDLAPALHDRVAKIDFVDVRFENRIYIRPAQAARTPIRAKEDTAAPATAGRRDSRKKR